MTLTFTVATDEGSFVNPGDAAISIGETTAQGADGALTVGQTAGKVVITLAADLNGDGRINAVDLLLMRKLLAKMSPTIVTGGADLNADGKQNALDLLLMRKTLAKMSPVIY